MFPTIRYPARQYKVVGTHNGVPFIFRTTAINANEAKHDARRAFPGAKNLRTVAMK